MSKVVFARPPSEELEHKSTRAPKSLPEFGMEEWAIEHLDFEHIIPMEMIRSGTVKEEDLPVFLAERAMDQLVAVLRENPQWFDVKTEYDMYTGGLRAVTRMKLMRPVR